jgi:23S rRNA (guanosine2251-2'-O)-methyltransferase
MTRLRDLVFGRHPVLERLRAGEPIDKIIVQRGASGENLLTIKQAAKEQQVPVTQAPREAMERLAFGKSSRVHQGVIAYTAAIRFQRLEDLIPFLYEQGEVPLIYVLDGITDVRNFGAIARTALASGAHGLVVGMRDVARASHDAVKASAGALHQIPVCRESSPAEAIATLQAHGVKVFGLAADGEHEAWELPLRDPVALVAGAEDRGLSNDSMARVDSTVRLPMPGDFDSYNVSVAVGMLAYEAARQRSER